MQAQQPSHTQQQQQQQMQQYSTTQQFYGGQQAQSQLAVRNGTGPRREPIFEKVFQNARFAQGGDALFTGRLVGDPMPRVSWTRKGAPLFESQKYRMSYNEQTGDVSLLIQKIGPEDIGEYTCFAANDFGEAICSVYIQFEGQNVPAMQRLENTQSVSQRQNNYNTSYSSYQEEFKVDTFEYRLLREHSFRESITKRYANETDIQISNSLEMQGPPVPPQIMQKPRNSKIAEGSDAVFSAQVGANPKPRMTWFKNGQRLIPSEKHQISYANQQATLRVTNSSSADSGHYTLLAENPQGVVVSSAVLAVEPRAQQPQYASRQSVEPYEVGTTEEGKALPPSFVRTFQDRDVTEGKMTRFDCRVTGRPYPEVFWFINDTQVRDDATHKILVNESGNHSLLITNVSRYDNGVVTCTARNTAVAGGPLPSIQAKLNVLEKEQVVAPKFVERFATVSVREGEPVQLTARAVGMPTPRITWQKDGIPIGPSANVRIFIDGGATSLDISRATAADAGWYQCTAQNVAGSTATRARFYVEQQPEEMPVERRQLNLPRPTRVIEPE